MVRFENEDGSLGNHFVHGNQTPMYTHNTHTQYTPQKVKANNILFSFNFLITKNYIFVVANSNVHWHLSSKTFYPFLRG